MSKCEFCDAGWPTRRVNFYDGQGSKRMHVRGSVTFDTYESHFCARNGWFSRHRFATGLIIFYAIAFLLACLSFGNARAHDDNHGGISDPAIQQWYRSLMQPDNPASSCCGEADAYWADEVHFRDGKTYATITDDRPDEPLGRPHIPSGTEVEIPNHKLKWDRANPTGHGVVFVSRQGYVFCYVQPGGA